MGVRRRPICSQPRLFGAELPRNCPQSETSRDSLRAPLAAASRALSDGDKRILIMAADGGANYVTESYNDEWVRQRLGKQIEADATPEDFLARAYEPENRPPAVGESVAHQGGSG